MTSGIAHMSFRGGGIFLPARSPYDRQILIEYVTDRVRAAAEVQVLLDGQRWLVQLHRGRPAACCTCCGSAARPTCYASANGQAAYCVNCAFGTDAAPVPKQGEQQGQMG